MFQVGGYVFKQAETEEEFEQIHSLNYRTFVSEIPQHPDEGRPTLVDKFHEKNTYFIALRDGCLRGMVSVHEQPPFSIADRLPDPSLLFRPGIKPMEVRLLAIEPDRRQGFAFGGIVWLIYEHAQQRGCTHLFISAVEQRLDLYQQMGFEPLGPAVRSGCANFVPMVVEVHQLGVTNHRFVELWSKRVNRGSPFKGKGLRTEGGETSMGGNESTIPDKPAPLAGPHRSPFLHSPASLLEGPTVCLLPGPVAVAPAVHEAFRQTPIYHRGPEFIALFQKVRRALGDLAGGRDVALFNGSGTLGNEVVAATLAAHAEPRRPLTLPSPPAGGEGRVRGRGLLLVNGEFGERLVSQASRFGLQPRVLRWPWGRPWDLDEVAAALDDEPAGSWVWGVHQESSTGVLNDLAGMVRVAQARGARVCMDCISSLGAVPLDLSKVFLATGATGKSLGSYAGIAIVFADRAALGPLDLSRVPSYLDLPAALASAGPRYTFPSPTLRALDAALAEYATPARAQARYDHYARLGAYVRAQLRQAGLEPLADEADAAPVVTTFAPPADETAEAFVARCRSWGFDIGGQSGYLATRRLVQVATMGAVTHEECAPLFEHLKTQRSAASGSPSSNRSALSAVLAD